VALVESQGHKRKMEGRHGHGDSRTPSTEPAFLRLGAKNESHCSHTNSRAPPRLESLHGFLRRVSFRKPVGLALTQADGDDFDRAAHDPDRRSSAAFGMVYRHAGPSNLYANAARGATAGSSGSCSTIKCRGCSKASSSCFQFAWQIFHAVGDPAASSNGERSTSAARAGRRRCVWGRAWRSDGWRNRWHAGRYQSPRSASPAASRPSSREGKSACAGGRQCPAATNYI